MARAFVDGLNDNKKYPLNKTYRTQMNIILQKQYPFMTKR